MKRQATCLTFVLAIGWGTLGSLCVLGAEDQSHSRQQAEQLFQDGNYQEALDKFQDFLQGEQADSRQLIESFQHALQCYAQLNRLYEMDAFRETVVRRHPQDWQLLAAVAGSYLDQSHQGFLIAGEFRRGPHRGGGKVVNTAARDRTRALQLFQAALKLVDKQPQQRSTDAAGRLLESFARAMLYGNDYRQAWRLQSLTDLSRLPEYEEGWGYRSGPPPGAPVDMHGKPVFYDLPESWDKARNDGERWRWLLERLVQWQPELRNQERLERARFLRSQFGVQTLADYGGWFGQQTAEDDSAKTGTFALHTLGENETIARLATGVQRFELPAEHNPIALLKQVIAIAKEASDDQRLAALSLANIFENRRQYPRAAEFLQLLVEGAKPQDKQQYRQRLEQIVGNWGRFESAMTQPAGQGATVDFRFRNGKRVDFLARRIRVRKLLDDVKSYLTKNPGRLNWSQVQLENLGHRLIVEGQEKYLGEEVARWSLDLQPLEKHFDRRISVTTPLQKPGAYLLTSHMADGNSCSIVLWLSDTAIVKKPLEGKALYYVADAVTGRPVPQANIEFFGFWQEHVEGKKFLVHTKNFAELTDDKGLVELKVDEKNGRYQWLATATTAKGRFAYLGFRGVWVGKYYDQQYQQVKVFSITDRPVYRPQQEVRFKFWVRHAQYDLGDESRFAAQSFQVEIRDPKNEKVFSTMLTADAYGGLAGAWPIPAGATLGQYRLLVVNHGGGVFRVEEYKKPEFEVTIDAPHEPVMLGERVTATISAKYYFGSPVTQATVKYKILRTAYQQAWRPPRPWDWLYGTGYGWLAEDYSWYPGWARWGCSRPRPWWFWHRSSPPEVVAEREVPIGPDGTVEVKIDTAVAQEFHPDQDHRYQIQAEVVDRSRRTIVGHGQVLVARRPFRVYVWTDRGYYRVGDTIAASFSARRLDGKPVSGTGILRLLKIQYDHGKPVETEAGRWDVDVNEEGLAELQIKASEAGQFRLSYELTDAAGHKIEGGHLFTITGEGFDGSQFRYNDLELVPDRREYQPGDQVALQINTNRTGAAVLLFLRPAGGVYLPPRLVQLKGKSTIVQFDVTAKDTPNFFVEAVTVHGGRVHTATRELFVPPAKRLLHVEVVPSAKAYLPGQAAKMLVKLTDAAGQPFVGSLALTVYDKALEYIAGGSNVADIREFFWKWHRSHRPRGETNLQRFSQTLVARNQPTMQNLGIFGGTVVDEVSSKSKFQDAYGDRRVRKSRLALGFEFQEAVPRAAAALADQSGAAPEEGAAEASVRSASDELVLPMVRENLADSALWVAAVKTNAEGIAEIELDMPENLTTWQVRVWGLGHGTRVGQGSAEVVTRKNIIVRLQAPRFFVERDEVVLSANVHNYLPETKQVRVRLELEGKTLEGPKQLEQLVEIEAGGERRVDWRVRAVREGTATIRMSALTDQESDAMQMSFPVYVHGMLRTESFSGVILPKDSTGGFTVSVPAERRADQTRLEIRYSPTLAGAMVDALPYLADYPYGCTEQTLNRFLPAVLAQQTLRRMKLDLTAIRDKRTNLNAQEIGNDAQRAQGWQRFERNPVFDEQELAEMVQAGVNRLTEMQLSDGGWGWFSGWGERSHPHTTAIVVHGLLAARENGVAIVPRVLERAVAWLENYQAEQLRLLDHWDDRKSLPPQPYKQYADNLDALVCMVLSEAQRAEASPATARMSNYLYRDRTHLAVYSLATLGLTLHTQGEQEKLTMVMRNLHQYVRQDEENQTAWLDLPGGRWWMWYGSETEAQAYFLKLLVATQPKSPLAPRLVKYLLNNRKHATYWNSTRDTALVIEAFADYLQASGEADPEVTVEVWIDGQKRKQVSINRDNLFTFDNKIVLAGNELDAGEHQVELRKTGRSPVYFNGYLTNFTLADNIAAAGLELKVQRRYFRLTPVEKKTEVVGGRGQVVAQQGEKFERSELKNLAELTSGDLVEVELTVDSKNDYEYILLEDMKAAGFEPVALRSGYHRNELGAYVELRDDRVSLFVTRLARGRHSVSYRLRAEIPGQFSALPTRVSAMYAPELKANSGEIKLQIAD